MRQIGITDKGKYISKQNRIKTIEYNKWNGMMRRCYSDTVHKEKPSYEDCNVCGEWMFFQNFAQWLNDNKWSEECTVLDKDFLYKNNKTYSPETCVLVDQRINSLLIKRQNYRGEFPIGVTRYKKDRFQARCSTNKGTRKSLGIYDTPLEAFQVYKSFKESYIKQVADEYKQKYPNFPDKLYQAMYNYKVETTD